MPKNEKFFKGNIFSDSSTPQIPQVPLYDKHGRQITNQREIEAEVERRRAEWKEWKEKGLIESEEEQVYQTPYGYISISSQSIKPLDSGSHRITSNPERFMEIDEGKSKASSTNSQQNEKSLHELEEELSYFKSLPDEKGYLRKNIQDLEEKNF